MNAIPNSESLSAASDPTLPFDPLLTIREASEATGLKYWLLLRAVKRGDIPFYRFGNSRPRVRLADIEAVIQRSMTQREFPT